MDHPWTPRLCGFRLGSADGTPATGQRDGGQPGLHSAGCHPAGSPRGGWVSPPKATTPLVTDSSTGFPSRGADRFLLLSSQL